METTINIKYDLFENLNDVALTLGKSKNKLIKVLLKYLEEDSDSQYKVFSTVEDQDIGSPSEWKLFHLVLSPSEYEFFTDMRNFFKMSLSLLIAIAIKKYLHLLLEKPDEQKLTDNYLFSNYIFIPKVLLGIKSFEIYWGKGKKQSKL